MVQLRLFPALKSGSCECSLTLSFDARIFRFRVDSLVVSSVQRWHEKNDFFFSEYFSVFGRYLTNLFRCFLSESVRICFFDKRVVKFFVSFRDLKKCCVAKWVCVVPTFNRNLGLGKSSLSISSKYDLFRPVYKKLLRRLLKGLTNRKWFLPTRAPARKHK